MKLGLNDRLQIYLLIKKEGSTGAMIIAHDLLDKIKLTPAEVKKYNIEAIPINSTGGLETKWNEAGTKYFKEFKITVLEQNEIIAALKDADTKQKITVEMIPLCRVLKFNPNK